MSSVGRGIQIHTAVCSDLGSFRPLAHPWEDEADEAMSHGSGFKF